MLGYVFFYVGMFVNDNFICNLNDMLCLLRNEYFYSERYSFFLKYRFCCCLKWIWFHGIKFNLLKKKNNFHSELSTQMNWPIIMERARCTFILLISQLINWFGMQWVDLVWHWFWYSTGMVFNLTSTHGCIQSNQFHFIITTSRCSAYETKVSIIKWAIII